MGEVCALTRFSRPPLATAFGIESRGQGRCFACENAFNFLTNCALQGYDNTTFGAEVLLPMIIDKNIIARRRNLPAVCGYVWSTISLNKALMPFLLGSRIYLCPLH